MRSLVVLGLCLSLWSCKKNNIEPVKINHQVASMSDLVIPDNFNFGTAYAMTGEIQVKDLEDKSLSGKKLPKIIKFNKKLLKDVDVVFTALPNGEAQDISKHLTKSNTLIDLAADFRLEKGSEYLKWYKQKHRAINLIKKDLKINEEKIKPFIKKLDFSKSRKLELKIGLGPSDKMKEPLYMTNKNNVHFRKSPEIGSETLFLLKEGEVVSVDKVTPGEYFGFIEVSLDKSKNIQLEGWINRSDLRLVNFNNIYKQQFERNK